MKTQTILLVTAVLVIGIFLWSLSKSKKEGAAAVSKVIFKGETVFSGVTGLYFKAGDILEGEIQPNGDFKTKIMSSYGWQTKIIPKGSFTTA